MGFSMDVSVSALTVFFQGLISFFSPCVLPLIPLYIGYLSGGTGKRGADGRIYYERKKVMLHTVCFVAGISAAFFVLGLGASALGSFLHNYQGVFTKIGGLLILLFGLYQLGVLGKSRVLGQEHRLPFRMDALAMSPVTALAMGFTFSFAWTPCVGPGLASVLLMAASAEQRGTGFLLIGVYTLGFVLPFLAVGFFTTSLLEVFKKYGNVVKYTVKAGGALMVLIGALMLGGGMERLAGYLAGGSAAPGQSEVSRDAGEERDGSRETDTAKHPESKSGQAQESGGDGADETALPAVDFTLTDQHGEVHTLSEYRGKTVFLNFWATWCGPCRNEMPEIQKLYEEYSGQDDADVVVLGIASPKHERGTSAEGIGQFLEENGYTYPVVMDESGEIFAKYGISSYPTTFMIDRDGNIYGYIRGQLSGEMMRDIIRQTIEGKKQP